MIRLVTLDFVLRVIGRGAVRVTLVVKIAGVNGFDRAADVTCFRVPGDVVTHLEFMSLQCTANALKKLSQWRHHCEKPKERAISLSCSSTAVGLVGFLRIMVSDLGEIRAGLSARKTLAPLGKSSLSRLRQSREPSCSHLIEHDFDIKKYQALA